MIIKNCQLCGTEFSKYPSYFKNRPGRFCSKKCDLENNSRAWKVHNPLKYYDNSGKNNPMYGKTPWNYNPNGSPRKDGYIRITVGGKRKLYHREVVEQFLGRPLRSDEIVHHLDGDNTNNDINNLTVMTQSEHINLHRVDLQAGKVVTSRR